MTVWVVERGEYDPARRDSHFVGPFPTLEEAKEFALTLPDQHGVTIYPVEGP